MATTRTFLPGVVVSGIELNTPGGLHPHPMHWSHPTPRLRHGPQGVLACRLHSGEAIASNKIAQPLGYGLDLGAQEERLRALKFWNEQGGTGWTTGLFEELVHRVLSRQVDPRAAHRHLHSRFVGF